MDRLANEQQASIQRLTEALEARNRHGIAARLAGASLLLAAVGLVWFAFPSVGTTQDVAPFFAAIAATILGTLLLARG
jgi:hypothetical protein